jgi:hypothetical protein
MIDSALLSLTLRRYAADGATGQAGAALTSVMALSISAQRLARKKRTRKARTGSSGSKPNSIGAKHNEAMGHRMTHSQGSNSVARLRRR